MLNFFQHQNYSITGQTFYRIDTKLATDDNQTMPDQSYQNPLHVQKRFSVTDNRIRWQRRQTRSGLISQPNFGLLT